MLKNFIRVAIRSILKQRIYSLINILGLAVGIATCIMILMHVEDEYSYDTFHEKSDRIHKVVLERSYPDHVTNYAVIPHSFAPVMASDIPEVKQSVRVVGNNQQAVQVTYIDEEDQRKSFEEFKFLLSDSNFFDMFTVEILKGDGEETLSTPQSMMISETTAFRYFGEEDPIDKTMQTDFGSFRVGGVYKDIADNSHFDFDFLASINSNPFFLQPNFVGFSAATYLELEEGADPKTVESKFPSLVDQYAAPQIEQNLNLNYDDYIEAGNGYNYTLLGLTDIHLEPKNYELEFKAGGNKNDVYIFISIAILILVIACINFMNLAIARSTERSREVGIRKTLGSLKFQLIGQFLTESVIISVFSLIIAVGLVFLALPYFNSMIGKELILNLDNSLVLPLLLLFAILVGVLAGSYPAFVLSSVNTILVLKGTTQSGKGGSWLRNGLVVLQFTISIILIVGTIVMRDQMEFMENKDLGFDRENMLIVERANVLQDQQNSFVTEARKISGVVRAGGSNSIPVGQYFGIQFVPQGATEPLTANGMVVDDDFAYTMDLEIIEGKGFSEDQNDSLYIIINEQTAKLLDTDNVIGTRMSNNIGNPPVTRQLEVIGVVKNFHYMSLRDEISPFVLLNQESFGANNPTGFISIKFNGDARPIISQLESTWRSMVPEEPFKYTFIDEELNDLYKNEINSSKKLTAFALLAIIIACIGLFGLSAYTSGLRTKEIGVRKVMGASVGKVVFLLSIDFAKLVIIAFVLAFPIGWFAMNQWLEGFAYQITISPMTFVWAGLLTLAIAWITVSYQSIKAASVNPVKSLRSE